MKFSPKTTRVFVVGFACGAAVALCAMALPSRPALLDRFFERQVESKAIAAWERQAVPVGYQECWDKPSSCMGKIVEWPVSRRSDGTTCWGTNVSQPIHWTNPQQAPGQTNPNYPFDAVARVSGIEPDGIMLTYIGTPSAAYGGTTWGEKFGFKQSVMQGRVK